MKRNPGKVLLLLAAVFFSIFVVLFVASSAIQADSNQSVLPTAELSKVYKQAVSSPLIEAASEIRNKEIAQFYQKLLQAYELNNTSENSSNDESLGLANLLPDIKKITKTASDLPLKEAGKQIKDEEIAEFYNRFLTLIGVDQ
jgi:hypothetical protein